jgi:hypothetical protein
MRKLLSSPVKMPLSERENQIFQSALTFIEPLSLNLMATKVMTRPEDFLSWCTELLRLLRDELNYDLLEPEQLPIVKKLQIILENAVSSSQCKMLRIAPWPIFIGFIDQQKELHAVDERLRLLDYIDEIRAKPLADLIEEDRFAFAGKHSNKHDISVYNFDVEWFASTKGAKIFHRLLAEKPQAFDHALSFIPLEGDIEFSQYKQFTAAYQAIFSSYTKEKSKGEKAPLAPATRLLAMRRPDQFIALTNSKIDVLCQGLSIAKFNAFDFGGYWHDMIGTIRTFAWWHQAKPIDEQELKLWRVRAILIDVFLFASPDLADKSNYVTLRDKPLKASSSKSASSSLARKRTKESAEMLVDRALSAEGLPEYLLSKRDSIVKQVKDGKSVEHAIGLMRAIFG